MVCSEEDGLTEVQLVLCWLRMWHAADAVVALGSAGAVACRWHEVPRFRRMWRARVAKVACAGPRLAQALIYK